MRKRLFPMLFLALSLGFTACTNDDDEEEPSNTEQTDTEDGDETSAGVDEDIKKVFKSLCHLNLETGSLFNFIERMPAGYYYTKDKQGNDVVFVKTADNGVMLFDIKRLGDKISYTNPMIAPDKTGYEYKNYVRTNGVWISDDFAPLLEKFTDANTDNLKEQLTVTPMTPYADICEFLFKCFLEQVPSANAMEPYKMKTEKSNVGGIDCNLYTLSPKEEAMAALLPVAFRFWATDKGIILKYESTGGLSMTDEFSYEPIGNDSFEDTFEAMMGKYNHYGAFKLSDCILSTTRAHDYIPANICNDPYFVHYNGLCKSYSVEYTGEKTLDGFIGVSFTAENVSLEEARAYVEKVKDLGLCTLDELNGENENMIFYKASNWDCTSPELGETEPYPSYKIMYIKERKQLEVDFSEARLSGV